MAQKVLEKTIVNNCIKRLNSLENCYVYKRWGRANDRGKPDITGAYNGKRIEIEVKRPGGKLTKIQQSWLDKWQSLGVITGVAFSPEDAESIIKGHITTKISHQ